MSNGELRKANFTMSLKSILLGILYISSTNSFFINVVGFDFNLSKLILTILLPYFVIRMAYQSEVNKTDIFFIVFILIASILALAKNSNKDLTGLTNFLFPFLCYKYFTKSKNLEINIKLLINIILIWTSIHAAFGLYQFISGDRTLVFFDDIQEFKLKYASEYQFNPFGELQLLPHGLYAYSSVFAISLIFPLFIILGNKNKLPLLIFYPLILLILFDIFICFSRFEILSAIFAIILATLVIKDTYIKKSYLYFTVFLFVIGVTASVLYFNYTLGQLGTIAARMVTERQLEIIFPDISTILGGGVSTNFRAIYNMDIPHNVFIYSTFSFGIIASLFLFFFLFKIGFEHLKYLFSINHLQNSPNFKSYSIITIFFLFTFLGRGFDYYIFDGYENIFDIFITLIIMNNYYKENITYNAS